LLKKDVFEKDQSALEEYRQKFIFFFFFDGLKIYRYTKAPQIFPRSYAGAIKTPSKHFG